MIDRRAANDFAACMRDLVDIHYPQAGHIRVVMDNLSTHTAAALYQSLPPGEARRLAKRLEFHHTPPPSSPTGSRPLEPQAGSAKARQLAEYGRN